MDINFISFIEFQDGKYPWSITNAAVRSYFLFCDCFWHDLCLWYRKLHDTWNIIQVILKKCMFYPYLICVYNPYLWFTFCYFTCISDSKSRQVSNLLFSWKVRNGRVLQVALQAFTACFEMGKCIPEYM